MISPIIAYPDYILDESDSKMDDEFEEYETAEGAYFQNRQNFIHDCAEVKACRIQCPVARHAPLKT